MNFLKELTLKKFAFIIFLFDSNNINAHIKIKVQMISISLSILLLNLCVQTCSSNTTTVASDYYVAPEGEVNYDENVVTSITAKSNKNVRPIETVSLTLKVNSFFTQWLFKGILIF